MLRNVVASTSYSATAAFSTLRAAAAPRGSLRHFSSSASRAEGEGSAPAATQSTQSEAASPGSASASSSSSTSAAARPAPVTMPGSTASSSSSSSSFSSSYQRTTSPSSFSSSSTSAYDTPFRRPITLHKLHVQTTRNNTLITLTRPNGATLYSVSSGQVGFKGANRSGFEAGYQTALNVFETIQRRRFEWGSKFRNEPLTWLHVVWNGFGQGRDAVYRAFLSSEGEAARAMVHTMSDATRIKIGGVRPKKRRNY